MMTESEFIRLSEELFEHIEDQIDENGWDFDCQFAGNVLTMKPKTARKSSSTATRPTKNCGLPPKSGGYHFAEQNGKWLATRDGRDFYDVLNEALSAASGEAVEIAEL